MGAGLASILTPEGSPRPGMGVGWGRKRGAAAQECTPAGL